MPEEKQRPKFEGERSMLPFFLAGIPLAYAAYRGRGQLGRVFQTAESAAAAQSAALDKVVGGRAASYFKELSAWAPDLGALAPGVEPLVVESFKRKLGPTGHAVHLSNLKTATEMVKGKPGLTAMLKRSFEEFAGLEAGAIGPTPEALLEGIPGAVKKIVPGEAVTLMAEGPWKTRLGALEELLGGLMRPELKMGGAEAVRIAGGLRDLATVAERTFGHKPTFHLMMHGKDAAASEMLITFPRTKGRALQFKLPLPTAEGVVREATGQAYFVRRVLADPATYARQGGRALDISAPEAIIQRLRNIITTPTDVPMGTRLREMQQDIRKLLIWQGPEAAAGAGVVSPRSAGRAFTRQVIVDPWGELSQAERIRAMERLGQAGRAAAMPPGPLGKNVVWTEEAAAEIPSILSPQHFGQAQTKGLPYNLPAEWEGAQLFQISPGGAQAAAERFGYEFVPRQDTIMMAEDMREALMGMSRRHISIDPSLPAGQRLQRIRQMLMDHKTTRDMLAGGSTVGEAIAAYAAPGPGRGPAIEEMQRLLTLRQGEILGFTQAGAVKAETYGMRTLIRDIRTVGEETIIETEARYPMMKAFSPGGVKHMVEYGDPRMVREIALYAKTEELLRAQTKTGEFLIPRNLKEETRRSMARMQAEELWKGSQGIIVEGNAPHDVARAWETWTKIDEGKKNMVRYNQLMMERLKEEGVVIPEKMARLQNLQMQRRQIEALARSRGFRPDVMFHPAMMARRVEQLRMGEAPGVAGLGRPGTYTDDVFELLRSQYGLTSVAEDIEARVARDIPIQRLMETTFRAVRAGEAALPGAIPYEEWAEMVFPKGEGFAGTIFDPLVRAEVQARGGILRLPRAYTVGGATVQHIPIPELESGYAGYFTTREGQVIQKDLDRALRSVMEATVMDVGAAGAPGVEPAAAAALEEYFGLIDKIRLTNRDLIGGKVAGSRIFVAGKWLDEAETIMTEAGEELIMPRVRITKSDFARMLKERVKKGLISDITAEELTQAFKAGRLPGTFVKHPAIGPLSAMPTFIGPAHEAAEPGVAYLDWALHRAMNVDLDFDQIHVDMASTRAAFDETTAALESGGVGKLIRRHEEISEAMQRGMWAREGVSIRREAMPLWIKGKVNPDVIRERVFREMSSKTDIGIFHTTVAQPIAQTARELGLGWEDVFITNLWREAVEEGSAIKIKHAMDMPPQLARQISDSFRQGRLDRLQNLTQDILQMKPGEAKSMMDDVINRMAAGYVSMSKEKRAYIEALYASKSRASAANLMTVADGQLGATMAGAQAAKGEIGAAGRISSTMTKMLGRAAEVVRGHKKGIGLTLAASAALGLIAARPRDLTPEAVESGQLAGGQLGMGTSSPMPPLSKNLHYREGSMPGFRVNARLNRIVDHEMVANKASQMTGNRPVRIDVTDRRRRITREQIELAMRDDRILGARKADFGFYNNYRG